MPDVPARLSSSQIALLLDELYGRTQRGWPPELRPKFVKRTLISALR